MSIIYIIISLSIFSIGLIIRTYMLWKFKWVGIDSFYHFIVAEEMRKERKIPFEISNYYVPEKYDYPPLLHIILSKIPKKYEQKMQYLSAIIDMLTALSIFIFCFSIYGIDVAFMAAAIYLVTPFTLDISLAFGPRSMGNFLLILYIFSIILYLGSGAIILFVSSVIISSLVLLTHRLTTQCMIMIILSISMLSLSFTPIIGLILSIALAIVATKGFYINVLKGHINFITIFSQKIVLEGFHPSVSKILTVIKTVLFNVPIISIMGLVIFFPVINFDLSIYWIGICIALLVISFVWPFGEGYRHIVNMVPALAILQAIWSINYSMIEYYGIYVLSLFLCIYKLVRLTKKIEIGTIVTKDMLDAFEYIGKRKHMNDLLLCIPLSFTYSAAYFTGCRMLQSSGGFANGLSFNKKLKNELEKTDFSDIISKYEIDWVFTINKEIITSQAVNMLQFGNVIVYHVCSHNKNDII